ncbi:MAG: SAM-dependent methyltransferase, partial [Mesorhizobium sp.]
VGRTLEANGLSIVALEPTTIRWDRREPVKGLSVVARKAQAV